MFSRKVGLSRNDSPRNSLLKNIKGRSSPHQGQSTTTTTTGVKDSATMEEDLNDVPPPEASSDEEDSGHVSHSSTKATCQDMGRSSMSDSDNEYNERQKATLIKPSFGTRNQKSVPRKMFAAQENSSSTKPTHEHGGRPGRATPEDISDSLDSSQETAAVPQPSHLLDKNRFTKTHGPTIRKPGKGICRKLTRTYSDKARFAAQATKKQNLAALPNSPEKSSFKMPRLSDSPEQMSPKAGFKRGPGVLDGREQSPGKKAFRGAKKIALEDSPELRPSLRLPGLADDSDDDMRTASLVGGEELSQLPTLRMPFALKGSDDELQPLRSAALDDLEELQDPVSSSFTFDGDLSDTEDTSNTARCPMCRAPVDPALLKKHAGVHRMNLKQQTAFCRLHQRKEASSTAAYPKIDWSRMESRLHDHKEFLKRILEGYELSHYAEEYQHKIKDKDQRTLFKSGDTLTPGYYGPRGLRLMTEYIVRDLGNVLRRRAVEDMLVSSRGHTRYVQAVLVPELTVQLIMEDMSVSASKARGVLEDSKVVGELLNDDIGDTVYEAFGDLEDSDG